ncbi:SCP2 sterol-binding domain-containing protein [Collimonas fungivorans]|uniref:Sterol-binding domain protein n=1 Tax=Collimonas fungivorans (strain Ter331) TaxID=1005048 RepID=G0AJA8_COLFT|nr:SCP2 sterol-binding domain-containing protein [Collimonas fungivorans]AEK61042.1 Sterol-binding domain protein [Collimonas fungivorans Ter331]
MTVNDIIKLMPSGLNSVAAADMKSSIQFDIAKPMYLLIDHGTCTAHEGVVDAPDVALTMADEDLKAMLKGELNGAMAFMSGKLKLKGDLMLAQRIPSLFDASKIG